MYYARVKCVSRFIRVFLSFVRFKIKKKKKRASFRAIFHDELNAEGTCVVFTTFVRKNERKNGGERYSRRKIIHILFLFPFPAVSSILPDELKPLSRNKGHTLAIMISLYLWTGWNWNLEEESFVYENDLDSHRLNSSWPQYISFPFFFFYFEIKFTDIILFYVQIQRNFARLKSKQQFCFAWNVMNM